MKMPLIGYPATVSQGLTIKDYLNDGQLQATALSQLGLRYQFDAIFPLMDLSVEAEAIGLSIRYHDDGPPDVVEHPVSRIEDIAALQIPNPTCSGRMPVFLEAICCMKETNDIVVGGYAASPFTLAGLLMGAEELFIQVLHDPACATACIEKATQIIVPYARAQQDSGADMLILLDPTAGLLSLQQYQMYARPYIEEVAAHVKIPVILHMCGQTTAIIDTIPDTMVVMGNIDPVGVMLQMDEVSVERKTCALINAMRSHRNFIVSTGCDVPRATSLKNVEAFMYACR